MTRLPSQLESADYSLLPPSLTHLREQLVLVVPDDGVGHEVDGLEGVDAHEGVELDVGVLEGDEGEVELALHRLQVRAQLVRLEHAQPHLVQGQLQVAEVVPGQRRLKLFHFQCCYFVISDRKR